MGRLSPFKCLLIFPLRIETTSMIGCVCLCSRLNKKKCVESEEVGGKEKSEEKVRSLQVWLFCMSTSLEKMESVCPLEKRK